MMYIVSFSHAIFLAGLWLFERGRTRSSGPDLLSLFLFIFTVQIVVPGIFITAVIAAFGGTINTNNSFFDRVYSQLSLFEPITTLIFSGWFVFSLYAGWLTASKIMNRWMGQKFGEQKRVHCSSLRLTLVMLLGLGGMWILLMALGGSLFESYQNLILFRAQDEGIERTCLTANLFYSAQTFALISILGLFIYDSRRYLCSKKLFALSCILIFGFMCASRRALAIQTLLIYFVFVLMNKKWYFYRFILPMTAVFFPVIAFGKGFLAKLATINVSDVNFLNLIDQNLFSSFLRGMSDIGISLVESWATLIYLDLPLRFGVDHLLSVARIIPVGFLFGWTKDFLPERIVRISTEHFLSSTELDIPPGLIGQMWLDFGFFGPIIWGLAFGLLIGFAQSYIKRFVRTYELTVLSVLLLFVIALPINTGSFDFTFSVDIFLLFILLAIVYGKRISVRSLSLARDEA